MHRILLATTALVAFTIAVRAQSVELTSAVITPGHGSMTDSDGTVWTITPDGSIEETLADNTVVWTPDGGGTAALTIVDGAVWGQDNGSGPVNQGGWFQLGAGQHPWAPSATPPPSPTPQPTSQPTPSGAPPATAVSPGSPSAIQKPPPPSVTDPGPGACTSGVPNYAASAGGFGVLDGQIYAPDGTLFKAAGINVDPSLLVSDFAQITEQFPGLNFIRVPVSNYADPSTFAAAVALYSSHGIVLEFENHANSSGQDAGGGDQNGNVIFTGQMQANESAWYVSMASYYKTNPYVWFGTNNEPALMNPATGQDDPAALIAWQQQTYNAIRNAENNNPIMLEVDTNYSLGGYANMTNVIGDFHYYGWVIPNNASQAQSNAYLSQAITTIQQNYPTADGTMPVIIGEYGNSSSGITIDPNANQVITSVSTSSQSSGGAAWSYNTGNPGDGLLNSDGSLSAYGQQVAASIATSGARGCAVSPVAQATQTTANPTPGLTSDAETAPALAPASTTVTAPPLATSTQTIDQVAAIAAAGP